MIDIHCHILPGIDDGPESLDESIEMARLAAKDGITTIVATPHIKNTLHEAALIRESVTALSQRLLDLAIPVTIKQGADVSALLDPSLLHEYTINGTPYILIEFPHSHLPRNAQEIIFNMRMKGLWPIITHPERNPSVIENPDLLLGLVTDGILVQLTADSLTGGFGPDRKACALYLLQRGAVSFLATDAHSIAFRRPVLSEGLQAAAKVIGRERAERLVTSHPAAVLAGKPLDA